MINFKVKLWQDDHVFWETKFPEFSLNFPGYFKLFPWATQERKTRWVHFCWRSCHIFFIFPEFPGFFHKNSNFPEFSWDFHNFSNSLSFPGFPSFPGLWPPCMRRIAPGWTAHWMNICSSPNKQHEYSYLSILFHQLSRLCNAWSQHAQPCFWLHWKGLKDFKEVPLHAPITWNTFQFKQKNMTNEACFHGQHFLCLKGIQNTSRSACLCNYFERKYYPKRVIKGQKEIKIWSSQFRGKSYPDIKLIHKMLPDSLWPRPIIGVNNHKMSLYFRTHSFLGGQEKRAMKLP